MTDKFTLEFSLDDFKFLYWTSMANFSHEQSHRFENRPDHQSREYKDGEGFLYWVGHQDGAADALIAFKILQDNGFEPNMLWDMAEHDNGSLWGHCILSTYQKDLVGEEKT